MKKPLLQFKKLFNEVFYNREPDFFSICALNMVKLKSLNPEWNSASGHLHFYPVAQSHELRDFPFLVIMTRLTRVNVIRLTMLINLSVIHESFYVFS